MNLAEKAKRAREQQEKQKRERKEQLLSNIIQYFVIAVICAEVIVTLGIVITAEMKNIPSLAIWHKVGIGVLIGCVVGAVLAFFFVKDDKKKVNLATVMICSVLFLGLVLWGMSGMLKA